MKRIVIAVFLILSCSIACAQVKFEKGWIMDNAGNKTECLIKDAGKFCAQSQVTYRLTKDSQSEVADIMDVKALYVGGTLYERHTFEYDESEAFLTANSSQSPDPEYVKTTAFLRVVCDGPARLYRYEVPNVKDNFFISTEEDPTPKYLINKLYFPDGKETVGMSENNTFRNQLYVALGNSGVSFEETRDLRYDERSLVEIFDKSNGTRTAARKVGSLNIELLGSYRPAKEGMSIGAGVSFEYVFAGTKDKWAVFATPEYKYRKSMEKKDRFKEDSEIIPVHSHTVQVSVGARYYMHLHPMWKLYADVGLGMGRGYFDSLMGGLGLKFDDIVSLGVHAHTSYHIFFFHPEKDDSMGFFEPPYTQWPVDFYLKFSIPVRKRDR